MKNGNPGGFKTCPLCAEEIKAAAIVCKHCGASLEEGDGGEHMFELGRCTKCGVSSTDAMTYKTPCRAVLQQTETSPDDAGTTLTQQETQADTMLHCPKCKSTQLTAQKQGFGLAKAAAGGVLVGGVGLLAGFVRSRKVTVTCLKCGHAWNPGK